MIDIEVLKLALSKEEDAIETYQKMLIEHPGLKELLSLLITEEQKHKVLIEKRLESLRSIKDISGMRILSSAFNHNAYIPSEFTCQGKGINPPLTFENIPKEAKSLVLIVDDPDALGGDFVHWVVYDMKITGFVAEASIPGKQGVNSLGKIGYVSPCPPTGTHRYFFKLYALDVILNLKEGINKYDLQEAMSGHIIEKAQLIGLYQKK